MFRVFNDLQVAKTQSLPVFNKQGENWVIYKVVIPICAGHHKKHLEQGSDHAGIQRLRKTYESFMPVPNGYMVEWDISKD